MLRKLCRSRWHFYVLKKSLNVLNKCWSFPLFHHCWWGGLFHHFHRVLMAVDTVMVCHQRQLIDFHSIPHELMLSNHVCLKRMLLKCNATRQKFMFVDLDIPCLTIHDSCSFQLVVYFIWISLCLKSFVGVKMTWPSKTKFIKGQRTSFGPHVFEIFVLGAKYRSVAWTVICSLFKPSNTFSTFSPNFFHRVYKTRYRCRRTGTGCPSGSPWMKFFGRKYSLDIITVQYL